MVVKGEINILFYSILFYSILFYSNQYFLEEGLMDLTIFGCFFTKKIKLWTHLTNCENPFSKPLQGACSGFPVTLKVVLKAAFDPENCSKSRTWHVHCALHIVHWMLEKIIDQWETRKAGTEVLTRLLEQFLDFVSVFKEASRNLLLFYL